MSMRIVLFGSTDLSLAVAREIADLGFPIAGVVTIEERFIISYRPDGVQNVRHADLRAWADDREIPTHPWSSTDDAMRFVQQHSGEFGLVAGWYHMVPARLRGAFQRGCAGLHASLLPELRGGAPLNWAILADLRRTGVSLFELGDGVDDGRIWAQREFPVHSRATVTDLVEEASNATTSLIRDCLPQIDAGSLTPRPQRGQVTYALQRFPEDGNIDWAKPATEVDRLVRATTHPYPGAYTFLDSKRIRIWGGEPQAGPLVLGQPGQLWRPPDGSTPSVVTGSGLLAIHSATDDSGESVLAELLGSGNRRLTPDPQAF